MNVHHLNCLKIESPFGSGIGHCLLLEDQGRLILIDSGIGLAETIDPEKSLGKDLVTMSGFKLDERLTAIRQVQEMGFDPRQVTDIICSHLDPDHIGGLKDFPHARIHVSVEEYAIFKTGNDRYLPQQLSHNPADGTL
jgi:glyoxylase-like metal-dependent hydrolase (beta-lactamase superfamily II)